MKRSINSVRVLLGLAALSILLASCSLLSGEAGTVRDMVDSTMNTLKSAGSLGATSFADQSTVDTLNAYGVDADEFLGYCFKHLEWEVGDIKLSGDTGTVGISITNVNIGSALEQAGERFDAYSATDEAMQLFDEEGEGALVKKLFGFLYEAIDSGEVETTTTDVTVEVFKNEDGSWEIKPDNDALYRALYGGADFKA